MKEADTPGEKIKPKTGKKVKSEKKEESKRKERSYTVRVLNNGTVEERLVTVGVSNRQFSEALSGLSEGDVVVVGTETDGKSKSQPTVTPRL